ncbi:MAG: rhomboid family intramembrane serine protease [Lactobacillaceae bacterium]|jgi:membrane associated rhomboid family serine protease|nr:rhomboid family intramembrane serine protease [Lactobacillaceae bacterium]
MQVTKKFIKPYFVSIIYTFICLQTFILYFIDPSLQINRIFGDTIDALNSGEFYRTITSFWIHYSSGMLVDLILLFIVGHLIEKYLGHLTLAILFPVFGIVGNIVCDIARQIILKRTINGAAPVWLNTNDLSGVYTGSSVAINALLAVLLLSVLFSSKIRNKYLSGQPIKITLIVILFLFFVISWITPLLLHEQFFFYEIAHILGFIIGFLTVLIYVGIVKIIKK